MIFPIYRCSIAYGQGKADFFRVPWFATCGLHRKSRCRTSLTNLESFAVVLHTTSGRVECFERVQTDTSGRNRVGLQGHTILAKSTSSISQYSTAFCIEQHPNTQSPFGSLGTQLSLLPLKSKEPGLRWEFSARTHTHPPNSLTEFARKQDQFVFIAL